MVALQPIDSQVNKLREMWRELWWVMSGGKVSEYDRLKKIDVFEFWFLYDKWKEQMKQQRDAAKAHAERKKR